MYNNGVTSNDVEFFLKNMKSHGYSVFEADTYPYNLNIVGWRKTPYISNKFNDVLGVYWKYKGEWNFRKWHITTLPGTYWLQNLIVPKGAAILVPGQYLGAYRLSPYKGYYALKQHAAVSVYRDKNKDSCFNMNSATIETGLFGIHIHKAGYISSLVDKYSAGCQVFQMQIDFEDFIDICQKAIPYWGNKFSYTLIEV